MTRCLSDLLRLLREFDAAGGFVELRDGDLQLSALKRAGHEIIGELRAARFDLLDLLDGRTPCTFCERTLDRRSAPGRVLEAGLGAHDGCLAEHHARRRALNLGTATARRRLMQAGRR